MPYLHGREYDLVVYGANGYTGLFTSEYIASHLPINLKWAIAGRSHEKLLEVLGGLRKLNGDREDPAIEVCSLDAGELDALAKKTALILTTVGPYSIYGEAVFKACAENGTHYLDVTGEVPFVGRMIKKYEHAAKASGALMFPQIGIESAPSDLITWSLANHIRRDLRSPTKDVTVAIHEINAVPSGGTMGSVFGIFENFSMRELLQYFKPFGLSPVPHPSPPMPRESLLSKAFGLVRHPKLGLLTTSLSGTTDAAIVQRGWGLISSTPSRQDEFYGPNFTFKQYYRPRNWFHGLAVHFGLIIGAFLLSIKPLRRLLKRFVYQPGEGQDKEEAKRSYIEYRGVGTPDTNDEGLKSKAAFSRAWF